MLAERRMSGPRVLLAGIVLTTLAWGGYLVWLVRADPRVVFLAPERGAHWLVANERVHLGIRYEGIFMAHFRTTLPAGPARDAVLTLRALRLAEVVVDGRAVFRTPSDLGLWKERHRVPLHLDAGDRPHELVITVVNESGFPALLAYAPDLGVATGSGW